MSEEYKAQGNKHFAAKEFDAAIEQFTLAINALPLPNHVLYLNRSACHALLKDFAAALADAEECVKINPAWAKGYNRVGAAYFGLGNMDKAKEAYGKALELDSGNAMAQAGLQAVAEHQPLPGAGLGQIFSDPNMLAKLRANPKTAEMMKDPQFVAKLAQLQSNPQAGMQLMLSDQRLMTVMGVLMGIDLDAAPGDFKEPEPEAKPAPAPKEPEPEPEPEPEEHDPSKKQKIDADAHKAQGNALYKARKFDEAIAAYDAAWEAHRDITYLNNRAAAEYEKGDYEAAIATCNKAVDEGREMRADYKLIAKLFARLGNAYLKLDQLEEAARYFDKLLTEHRTPDVLTKLRQTQKEIKVREAQAYVDPAKAEAARLEGKELFSKGDWPGAVKAYSEMIARAPEDARGYLNRAAALAKLMSFPDAVEDCNKAIARDPAFIRAYIRKASAQLAMKEYSLVLDTLTVAREQDAAAGGHNTGEIDSLYSRAMLQRFLAIEGETPEQTMERVLRDPEIVAILQDPVMQGILGQARENPAALQDHMRNPAVSKKINMLIAAGVIRTR